MRETWKRKSGMYSGYYKDSIGHWQYEVRPCSRFDRYNCLDMFYMTIPKLLFIADEINSSRRPNYISAWEAFYDPDLRPPYPWDNSPETNFNILPKGDK